MFFLGDIIKPKKQRIQFRAYAIYGLYMIIYEQGDLFENTNMTVKRMLDINYFELVD